MFCNVSLQFFQNMLFTFMLLQIWSKKHWKSATMVMHIHIVFTHKKNETGNFHITLFKRYRKLANFFFFLNTINEFHTYLIHCIIEVTWNESEKHDLKATITNSSNLKCLKIMLKCTLMFCKTFLYHLIYSKC